VFEEDKNAAAIESSDEATAREHSRARPAEGMTRALAQVKTPSQI